MLRTNQNPHSPALLRGGTVGEPGVKLSLGRREKQGKAVVDLFLFLTATKQTRIAS